MRKRFLIIISAVLILCMIGMPVYAKENIKMLGSTEQDIVQPCFTNIILFQNGFDISETGKASVSVYLTAQNVDRVQVDAYLQQYINGSWMTIKSWTNTAVGTNSGLCGTYYVSRGYLYRVFSRGSVYKGSTLVETTTYTSETRVY